MELLIRVIDKTNQDDPALNARLTKAGDVIAYKPDGQEWGLAELNHDFWRIIKVPGMTETQAQALIAEQLPIGTTPGQILHRRQISLDLRDLHKADGNLLKPRAVRVHTRSDGTHLDATIPLDKFLPAHSLKPRLKNPTHIGPDGNVIG